MRSFSFLSEVATCVGARGCFLRGLRKRHTNPCFRKTCQKGAFGATWGGTSEPIVSVEHVAVADAATNAFDLKDTTTEIETQQNICGGCEGDLAVAFCFCGWGCARFARGSGACAECVRGCGACAECARRCGTFGVRCIEWKGSHGVGAVAKKIFVRVSQGGARAS